MTEAFVGWALMALAALGGGLAGHAITRRRARSGIRASLQRRFVR